MDDETSGIPKEATIFNAAQAKAEFEADLNKAQVSQPAEETAKKPERKESEVNTSNGVEEQVAQAGSQSRISRLKDLLGKIKTRRVGNNTVSESGDADNAEDTPQELEIDKPKDIQEQKPVAEIFQPEQSSAEISDVEPIKPETIEGICDVMAKIPRLNEAYGHDIPYRMERRMQTNGVFDEETGLYVEASYVPSESKYNGAISRVRRMSGLTVVLSTPPLIDQETTAVSLGKMGEALRRIYGNSEELEKDIRAVKYWVKEDSEYDRVKFELSYDNKEVLNGFSAISGKSYEIINPNSPKKPILETGGQFIKEIVERAAQKQIEESEENKQQTQQAIDKVKDEAVPNDESAVYQYAYHATEDRGNIPNISQNGLLPSGELSKEPGTIWFTGWDTATLYHPNDGTGVLYRFRVQDIPEIAKSWNFDSEEGLRGDGITRATDKRIAPEYLDLSLDAGQMWMPAVSRITKQSA